MLLRYINDVIDHMILVYWQYNVPWASIQSLVSANSINDDDEQWNKWRGCNFIKELKEFGRPKSHCNFFKFAGHTDYIIGWLWRCLLSCTFKQMLAKIIWEDKRNLHENKFQCHLIVIKIGLAPFQVVYISCK